jgi:hypothetical protein
LADNQQNDPTQRRDAGIAIKKAREYIRGLYDFIEEIVPFSANILQSVKATAIPDQSMISQCGCYYRS